MLGVLAVAGVIFALQTIFLTREFRSMDVKVNQAKRSLFQAQALAGDVAVYNQKNPSPELTKLLQSLQAKPAAH